MEAPRRFAERASNRAWLARWAMRDTLAGVSRRVPEGTVALTFDDGPNPFSTGRVLDVLASLDVRATFFCVGANVRAHPEIVRRSLAEGHAVGSHSESHPHPAHTPIRVLARDYRAGHDALGSVSGTEARLFRPPHGHPTVMSALMVRTCMESTWLWTVDPQDWKPGVSPQHVATVGGTAGSGDVILLHDWVEQPLSPQAQDRSATIDALPAIVHSVRSKGLTFTVLHV